MKPLWLLDVDGVLNAVTREPVLSEWDDMTLTRASANGRSWPIWYSPALIARINALVEMDRVEVRWLTTWTHDAAQHLSPVIGLDGAEWGVVERRPPTSYRWWKLEAAQRVMDEEGVRPLVWTDDDLRYERLAMHWLNAEVEHYMAISPKPHIGLTPRHLDAIEAYCFKHVESAA